MNKKNIIIIIALAAFFVLVGAGIAAVLNVSDERLQQQSLETLQTSEGRDNHHAVGRNILDGEFTGVINDSGSFRETIASNDVTVVNFFASWCDPCRRETPELIEYQDSRGGESLDVVGISIDDSDSSRDKFLEEFGVTYPVYEFADEPAAIESYKIHLMPTTFFVDSEGTIVRAYIGEVGTDLIDSYVNYVKEES
ncbi:MAG TPA: TlpA family protein disulfide reductase [Candidatus Salinicoccus stercoripullorum]|uniref:TlpA family protein disulfide reductase n=1 Tax=Candidatus Salinicoccus stercoripullorum TaxID=2838756 RepID=A0A9D1QH30_9STAP|nr:TlpA family protein disulfide reductase [Candidatus Salinicoccus stercoripullorum]